MSREITKRFAAIGDELSPPKPKAAPKRVTMGNNTELREAKIDWRELERCERERVVAELGPGLDTNVIDGIVQAALELTNAQLINDQNKVAWWRQRLDYIREQARKQLRGMLASPLGVPMTPSLIESFKTMDWVQQEIAKVTGIKQDQMIDYTTDDLVVIRRYPDGKVSKERISRYDIIDNVPCPKCGGSRFYPDGKTYHLCTAVSANAQRYGW